MRFLEIQFNGVRLTANINSIHARRSTGDDGRRFDGLHNEAPPEKQLMGQQEMRIQSKYRNSLPESGVRGRSVAIASTAAILFDDFGPSHASQDRGTATMISAAAISKAGAIEISSAPSVSPPTSLSGY